MFQLRRRPGFVLKPFDHAVIEHGRKGEDFHRNALAERTLTSLEDNAHSATTDFVYQLEIAKHSSGNEIASHRGALWSACL